MSQQATAKSSRRTQPNGAVPRLTNRQMTIVRDFAQGWDVATVAEHQDRSLSSVYEIAVRICDRLELDNWTQIGPYAVAHGLATPTTP